MWHSIKLVEVQLEVRADVDICALVLGAVAIPGSGEYGDAATVVLLFVTLHPDLVTSDDGFETILLAEALGDIGSELQTDATLAGSSAGCGLRVGPEHLHHETTLTWLALVMAVELPDVVESDVVVREEAAVKHKVLVADESG